MEEYEFTEAELSEAELNETVGGVAWPAVVAAYKAGKYVGTTLQELYKKWKSGTLPHGGGGHTF